MGESLTTIELAEMAEVSQFWPGMLLRTHGFCSIQRE